MDFEKLRRNAARRSETAAMKNKINRVVKEGGVGVY